MAFPNLEQLTHVVECQYAGKSFFETIASFNCESVAIGYADDCAVNSLHSYRVLVKTSHTNYNVIHETNPRE